MNQATHIARPLDALNRVLASLDSVRNGRAVCALLATFAAAGLLLALAESALAHSAVVWGGASLTTLFCGSNAAGLLLFDEARGLPTRAVGVALRDAPATAHRLMPVLICVLALGLGLLALLAATLWTTRVPWVGPALLGLLLPAALVVVGVATLALLLRHARQRLVYVALLMSAVSGLAALVGALITFSVMTGGREVSALAVVAAGIDLPPQMLMAGMFGHGLRSLGAAGAPVVQSPCGQAVLAGGGVVFMLASVLPALVYLRETCSVYQALEQRDETVLG